MRYIVCTPDQKLAVFDEDEDGGIVEFEAWDFDPETDLDKMYDRLFSNVGRRLFEAELSYAKRELSPLADWQIEDNEFSTRWERAVSKLVLYHDTEHALQILSEMGFPNYVLPLRLLEARAAQDRVEEASPRWEKAYPEWKSPIVDSTKDEGVWGQI